MVSTGILALGAMAAAASATGEPKGPRFERDFELRGRFYRGNLHTHSLRSDGDSSPEQAVSWYRDHGYQFVALTDHNFASVRGEFKGLENEGFKVVSGEEVSYASHRHGELVSVHVNALCSSRTAGGKVMDPVASSLQAALDSVTAQPGTIAQINHPNYEWALELEDLGAARGAMLLEVYNQHPHVRNDGDARHPSVEALWDRLLASGKRFYGVADDDTHDILRDPGFAPRRPGKGWVQVAAASLEDAALCEALAAGRFYSSSGVELERVTVRGSELSLRVRAAAGVPESAYVTEFVGRGGVVLATARGLEPAYSLRGGEIYVRARVKGPGNARAWTQPAFGSLTPF